MTERRIVDVAALRDRAEAYNKALENEKELEDRLQTIAAEIEKSKQQLESSTDLKKKAEQELRDVMCQQEGMRSCQ
jgi:hypothetical protein